MNTQNYNGFTNYETWLCNKWFDSRYFIDFTDIMDMFDNCEDNCDVLDIIEEHIKSTVEEFVEYSLSPASQPGFIYDLLNAAISTIDWRDMLNAAISKIDWRDIAEHYVDDVVDELKLIKDDAKSELMGV